MCPQRLQKPKRQGTGLGALSTGDPPGKWEARWVGPHRKRPAFVELRRRGPALVCWGFPAGFYDKVAKGRKLANPSPGSGLEAESGASGEVTVPSRRWPGHLGGRNTKYTVPDGLLAMRG